METDGAELVYVLRLEQLAPADAKNRMFDPQVRMYIADPDGGQIDLMNEPLEIDRLAPWFLENLPRICVESTPFDLLPGESVAAGYRRVHGLVPQIEELTGSLEMFSAAQELMIDYQMSHCLARALGGMNMPEIYFGIGVDGPEVSCDDGGDWTWRHYPVDYEEFQSWLGEEMLSGRIDRWEVPGSAEYLQRLSEEARRSE